MDNLELIFRPFYRVYGLMAPTINMYRRFALPFSAYDGFVGDYADTIRILKEYGSDEIKQRVADVRTT